MNDQRLQACLLETGLFPSELQLHSLKKPIFSNEILTALSMQGFQSVGCIFVEQLKFREILHKLSEYMVLKKQQNDLKLGNVIEVFFFGGIPLSVY